MKTTMILALAGMLATVPAAATVTPTSGSVAARVEARIGSGSNQSGPDVLESWTTLQPNTTFQAISNKVINFSDPLTGINAGLTTYRAMNATWSSATAGTVRADWGWNFTGGVAPKVALPEIDFKPNWSYAFNLTTPSELNLNAVRKYSSSNGDFSGLNGFIFLLNDSDPGFFLDQNFDLPSSSVSRTLLLAPGSYELQLRGNTGVSATIGEWIADGEFELDWSIDPVTSGVPEPTSWAMLIAGFGLTGISMRRRQAQLRRVTA